MIIAFLFITELFILFLLSQTLTNLLFVFFHKLTKSKRISIYLMSFLFLPGTLIHELSHTLMATILFVPVGKMELLPKLVGGNLKLGSVEVAKSDPFRRILIGTAPFLFGTALIIGFFLYAIQTNLFNHKLSVIVISYLIFEIGNTMFSSRKDMEGAIDVVLALIIISIIFYIVGFRLPTLNPELVFSNPVVKQILQKATLYLIAPVGIDLLLITVLKLLRY